jgi:hypothetical protein
MLNGLGDTGTGGIDKVLDGLRLDFPENIVESISNRAKARLQQIGGIRRLAIVQ